MPPRRRDRKPAGPAAAVHRVRAAALDAAPRAAAPVDLGAAADSRVVDPAAAAVALASR